jgi:hypothetical protein
MRNIIGLRTIRIADIERPVGLQMRAAMSEDAVLDYQAVFERGGHLPPVTLFFDGERNWMGDGFHRVEGRLRWSNGDESATIEAEVQRGTQRDALLHALGANASHGLRRSNADKRRVVETILQDDEWGTWSNRRIAEHCGVSDPFVGKVRDELGLPQPETRVGLDGRERAVPSARGTAPGPQPTANGSQSDTDPTRETSGAPTPVGHVTGDMNEDNLAERLAQVAAELAAITPDLPGQDPKAARTALKRAADVLSEQARIVNAALRAARNQA